MTTTLTRYGADMDEDKTELKPCPFCGSELVWMKIDNVVRLDGYIECGGCYVEVRYGDCLKSAIVLWNKRAK